jgi:hypothetical protein
VTRLVFVLIALACATEAQASTRSYAFPMVDGHRVSACLSDGATCGKPAADAFCKTQGFAESLMFAREEVAEARALDVKEATATGPQEAFKRIKCYLPKDVVVGQTE